MTSKEIFEAAVGVIKQAQIADDPNVDNLISLGFDKKDLNENEKLSGRAPNDLFTKIGTDGHRVEVHAYAYDPTKTFGPIEPDMNKFYVRLIEGEKVTESFHTSFPDKPYGS
ncbi:hypothetical protein ACQKLP_19040 [Chitinophaga sp. NPDC101104]|uniref:hypothetical protein n=1 Tax=Chitinophaga sp. NPDC101104 TaxID=3390561 RepID=UPI003D053D5D